MKKRKVLNKLGLTTLSIIMLLDVLLLSSECDNFVLFVVSKIILLLILVICSKIFYKYLPKKYM